MEIKNMDIDIKKQVKIYTYQEFKDLNKLSLLDEGNIILKYLENEKNINHIALLEDDIVIENNLDVDHLFEEITKQFKNDYKFGHGWLETPQLIWFSGHVVIKNSLYAKELENYSIGIVFENSFQANNIILGGIEIAFLGDVTIDHILYIQEQSEGFYTLFTNKNILINISSHNQIYTKNNESYDLSVVNEKITAEQIDKIFIHLNRFFEIAEDEDEKTDKTYYYGIDNDDDDLIEALLNNENIFLK
jgi:hypothetical protein